MSSLKELQESFQRGILAGDDAILSEIKDSPKEKRKVLFGVYRNAYVQRSPKLPHWKKPSPTPSMAPRQSR
jgi:hypothetical protein